MDFFEIYVKYKTLKVKFVEKIAQVLFELLPLNGTITFFETILKYKLLQFKLK